MNIKEAFRYQNYLDNMMQRANMYLSCVVNVTKTKQTHFRKKANPDAEDETLEDTQKRALGEYEVNRLVSFYCALADEKIGLCDAIDDAKCNYMPLRYDASLAANRCRQAVANTLRHMASIKSTEAVSTERGYKLNANGEQVPYVYDMKSVTTIDFDRDIVKKLAKAYTDRANDVSDMLDRALLDIEVVFTPRFNMMESFEETVESFMDKK